MYKVQTLPSAKHCVTTDQSYHSFSLSVIGHYLICCSVHTEIAKCVVCIAFLSHSDKPMRYFKNMGNQKRIDQKRWKYSKEMKSDHTLVLLF